MNQQPDKLFREKLEGFQKPTPANAWSRVEAGLTKKNDRTLWLKVAASFLLLAAAVALLWPQQDVPPQLTEKNTGIKGPEKNTTPRQKEVAVVQPPAASEEKRSELPAAQPKRIKPREKKQKTTATPLQEEMITTEIVTAAAEPEEEKTLTVPEVTLAEIETFVAETSVAQNAGETDGGVTLVYTAEEVNEKYLDKKSLAEATSSDRKPSTLRKLLDKAYDLKHNQDPFGDLRQKKNEILALNFKSEKQRSQNK
jgi:hypothetical protein